MNKNLREKVAWYRRVLALSCVLTLHLIWMIRPACGQTKDDAENLLTKFVTMGEEVNKCCSYAYVLETDFIPHPSEGEPKFITIIVRYASNGDAMGRRDAAQYFLIVDENLSRNCVYHESEIRVDGKLYHSGLDKPIQESLFPIVHYHPFGVFTSGYYNEGYGKTAPDKVAEWASNLVFIDAKAVKKGVVAYWHDLNGAGFYKIEFHQDFGYMPVSVEYRWCGTEKGQNLKSLEEWTEATRFFFRVEGEWKPIGEYWVPTYVRLDESHPVGDGRKEMKQRFYIANWTVGDPSFGEKDFSRARALLEHPLAIKSFDFDVERFTKSKSQTPIAFFEKLESQIREALGKKK